MRVRMILAALALAVSGVMVAPVHSPAQAAAAYPKCETGRWFEWGIGPYTAFQPAARDDFGGHSACLLRNGDYNNFGVVALQNALIRCYGQAIAADGDFGTATERAVKNVQTVHRIKVDGIYGPETMWNMKWPLYRPNAPIDRPDHCSPGMSN